MRLVVTCSSVATATALSNSLAPCSFLLVLTKSEIADTPGARRARAKARPRFRVVLRQGSVSGELGEERERPSLQLGPQIARSRRAGETEPRESCADLVGRSRKGQRREWTLAESFLWSGDGASCLADPFEQAQTPKSDREIGSRGTGAHFRLVHRRRLVIVVALCRLC